MLATMITGGVPAQVAAWSMDIVSLYVAADVYEGWLLKERFDDGSGRDPERVGQEFVGQIAAAFAQVPADRYPFLVAHAPAMMTGGSDARFAFGIDMLIAGFAAQAERAERTRRTGSP